jgi:hypothetical protein
MVDFYYFSFDFITVLMIMALALFFVGLLRVVSRLSIFSSDYKRSGERFTFSDGRLSVHIDYRKNS